MDMKEISLLDEQQKIRLLQPVSVEGTAPELTSGFLHWASEDQLHLLVLHSSESKK
jgi:hypothetical protein